MDHLERLSFQDLHLRLRPVNRVLRAAVERQAESASRLVRPDVTALCVTDEQVKVLLTDIENTAVKMPSGIEPFSFTDEEVSVLEKLRIHAGSAHLVLPFDRLAQDLKLTTFEQASILLCLAPELNRAYERIYAYINDDLNRRYPSVELICTVLAVDLETRLRYLRFLSSSGRLRRFGILIPRRNDSAELQDGLRPAPGLLDFLAGRIGNCLGLFRDSSDIPKPKNIVLPGTVDQEMVDHLGAALADGRVDVVGIWGPKSAGIEEAAFAISGKAGKHMRRWLTFDRSVPENDIESSLKKSIREAQLLDTALWLKTDELSDPFIETRSDLLGDTLASSSVPLILTGIHPWRPIQLLCQRRYAEMELEPPGFNARIETWSQIIPDLSLEKRADLAARLRLSPEKIGAAASVARTRMRLAGNGQPLCIDDYIENACKAVTHKRSGRFVSVMKPKRGPDDLVLPPLLHAQIIDIGKYFRSWPRVSENWGFGKAGLGGRGVKVLFSGDSGTGKTLAAEVIAGTVGTLLLKVDLGRVTSKWVGETEKNLETAFQEAEDSHAVLFFDEAEALFGKRGESRTGTDRYANLEVSFLLQRLEEFDGLVILASNLKDQIDSAFMRRFHVVVRFPRPSEAERLRLWQIAFPAEAPLADDADLEALSHLDMTGASIVASARTASLLAADDNFGSISMVHVVQAIARQYQQEARVLPPAELGFYAELLNEQL
jgi:hypothetical protein